MNSFDAGAFNERLEQAIRRAGKSQRQASADAGFCIDYISKAKRAKMGPTASSIFELCRTLHISADWLLGLED